MTLWILLACAVCAGLGLYVMMRRPRRAGTRARAGSGGPALDAQHLRCSCEEWRTLRARFRPGDPRRLCVHLCAHFSAGMPGLPQELRPFAPLLARMGGAGLGVPCETPSFAFALGDAGYIVVMPPHLHPWVTVHGGAVDYTLHLGDGHWGDGGEPPFGKDIGALIRAEARRRAQKKKTPDAASP